jgi:ABC-2 type transport system ATP-binding protein
MRKDAGSVQVFGREQEPDDIELRERIGFVYDEQGFHGGMTVGATGRMVAPFYHRWSAEEFARLLRKFSMDPTRKTADLSRGQRMRLALAIALAHEADLLIMDEPTSGLDPVFRSELIDIFHGVIQDERKAIFFSTHLTSDLEKIADFVTFIDEGRIVFSESKEALQDRYRIVKGPTEALTDRARSLCAGVRETGTGFEALSASADDLAALVGSTAVVDKANLTSWSTCREGTGMGSRVISLLAKDLVALRSERSAALTFILMMVVSPLLASSPAIATLIFTVYVLSMCCIQAFSIDEKYHTERFTASLAVRRREIVMARYAGTLVVMAAYFILAFFVNALEIVLRNRLIHPIPLGYCAMLVASVMVVTALSFPFYFRLGVMKARLVTIALYILPVMLVGIGGGLGIVSGSFPSLAVLSRPSPSLFSISPLASGIIVGAGLLLWLASIPITVRLYETRDL